MNKFRKNFIKKAALAAAVLLFILSVVLLTTIGCRKTQTTPTEAEPSTGGETAGKTPLTGTASLTETGKNSDDSIKYYSPSSVSISGDDIYVSDSGMNIVTRFSSDGKSVKQVSFDGTVEKVITDNDSVYVLSGGSAGMLTVLDRNLEKKSETSVGHTPADIVVNDGFAYVINRFSSDLYAVDLSNAKITGVYEIGREPKSMALVGNKLYIGCFLPDEASDTDYLPSDDKNISAKVAVFDISAKKVTDNISLANGTKCISGIAVSPDEKSVYVTHLVGRYAYPTTQLDRSWVNSNAFSIINTDDLSYVSLLLDDLENGAANPYDVECSSDGKTLYFSLSGTGEIVTLDVEEMNAQLSKVEKGSYTYCSELSELVNYIPFLNKLKTRHSLTGEGIRDIELADGKLYVTEYFTGGVEVLSLPSMESIITLSAGEQPEMNSERYGEYLWNDATTTYQQWQSCASCHPDGRADGLNWDEAGDGLGTPKNTPSIVYSFRTPPVMKTGLCINAEEMVAESVVGAKLAVFTEEQLEAMNAYLRSLLPVESPYLENGGYSSSALEGKALFEEVGCAKCHPAPLYTDLKTHISPYLGADGSWENRAFVTPTLVELWRTAPYIFNGGFTDVTDMITKFSNRTLSESETENIRQFILSIGVVGEAYGVEEIIGTKDGETVYTLLIPDMTLDALTIRCQKVDADDVTALITLVSSDGRICFEKKKSLKNMYYGQPATVVINEKIPSDFSNGGYLKVVFSNGEGETVGSEYRLVYNG